MRFLFVYQDFAVRARDLLTRVPCRDVHLILVRMDEREPPPPERALLLLHPRAPAAACQVVRHYRKALATLVELQYEPNAFRDDDRQLIDWLSGTSAVPEIATYRKPRETFEQVASRTPNLVLAPEALTKADEIAQLRWGFVDRAASLLGRYALNEDLGPLREWQSRHRCQFAANGPVRFQYSLDNLSVSPTRTSEWHLKEGDHTTREAAARVYFARVELKSGGTRVIVFYCGPHPPDGTRHVTINCPGKFVPSIT